MHTGIFAFLITHALMPSFSRCRNTKITQTALCKTPSCTYTSIIIDGAAGTWTRQSIISRHRGDVTPRMRCFWHRYTRIYAVCSSSIGLNERSRASSPDARMTLASGGRCAGGRDVTHHSLSLSVSLQLAPQALLLLTLERKFTSEPCSENGVDIRTTRYAKGGAPYLFTTASASASASTIRSCCVMSVERQPCANQQQYRCVIKSSCVAAAFTF